MPQQVNKVPSIPKSGEVQPSPLRFKGKEDKFIILDPTVRNYILNSCIFSAGSLFLNFVLIGLLLYLIFRH